MGRPDKRKGEPLNGLGDRALWIKILKARATNRGERKGLICVPVRKIKIREEATFKIKKPQIGKSQGRKGFRSFASFWLGGLSPYQGEMFINVLTTRGGSRI